MRLCSRHCLDQCPDPDDVDDPFEIIGEPMQAHLGADPAPGFGQKMIRSHPRLDGPAFDPLLQKRL